jgi:hypothetical protein
MHMKKSCRTLAIFATLTIIAAPQAVTAFTAQDCKDMGAAFQDAIKSKAVFSLFGERHDWQKNGYRKLRPDLQESIDVAVKEIDIGIEPVTSTLKRKIPEWNSRGMKGDELARQVLMRAIEDAGGRFTTSCLKEGR